MAKIGETDYFAFEAAAKTQFGIDGFDERYAVPADETMAQLGTVLNNDRKDPLGQQKRDKALAALTANFLPRLYDKIIDEDKRFDVAELEVEDLLDCAALAVFDTARRVNAGKQKDPVMAYRTRVWDGLERALSPLDKPEHELLPPEHAVEISDKTDHAESVETQVSRRVLKFNLGELMSQLPSQRFKVIYYRYGLGEGKDEIPKRPDEVAALIGGRAVGRTRIQQIEDATLYFLRCRAKETGLISKGDHIPMPVNTGATRESAIVRSERHKLEVEGVSLTLAPIMNERIRREAISRYNQGKRDTPAEQAYHMYVTEAARLRSNLAGPGSSHIKNTEAYLGWLKARFEAALEQSYIEEPIAA